MLKRFIVIPPSATPYLYFHVDAFGLHRAHGVCIIALRCFPSSAFSSDLQSGVANLDSD